MAPLVGSGLWFGTSSRGFGVFAIGNTTLTTNIFTYSSAAVAASTNLTSNSEYGAATGNSTEGVFALGYAGTSPSPTTNIFTYANAAVAASTNLTSGTSDGAAAGNSTEGVFALGDTSTTTNIFTYANAAVAASTNLTSNLYGGAASSASPGGF